MTRKAQDLLRQACSNRGIEVEVKHKTNVRLILPNERTIVYPSLQSAWEGYKSNPDIHGLPLVCGVTPRRP